MKKLLKVFSCTAACVLTMCASITFTGCSETYDLTYATWNLSTEAANNIERQMVAAFEEKYDVKIKLEESISLTAYDDSIRALAVKDNLPDVFMTSTIDFGLSEGYASDISDLVAADTTGDWNDIPTVLEEAVHYGDGIYAVPFAMHMMGYFVNVDLLEQYNLDGFLDEELTWDSLYNVIKTMASYKSDGVIGLSHQDTIFEWYPASVNDDYGWFTWDGEEYHLDSDEFKEAISITNDLYSNGYTYDSLTEEERLKYFEGYEGYTQLWNDGKLAIRWGETYEMPDMLENNGGTFNIKFIGVPGGRTPIVGDYLMISTECKNKELAYKFAKWMSFDPEGIAKRIELEDETITNTLPLTVNEDLIDQYFDKFTAVSGIKEMWENLDNGIVEATKVVPGYTKSRWNARTGVTLTITSGGVSSTLENAKIGELIDQCWMGNLSYADYATSVNKLANLQYTNAIAGYSDYYNK